MAPEGPMDYDAATRVRTFILCLTEGKASSVDETKLKELKGLLRTSNELVTYAYGLLTDRLAANHSQTRKLALQLCDVLFGRSKCFRRLLTAQFSQFVELTVGHKADKPLPAPPASAVELRQTALETIEQWHEQWGLQYPQVTLAYKYLKKHYKFPEIASRAAAAAAAEAARHQRHQQMLQQRYEAFKQDFPQQQQDLQSLLHQMQECYMLLRQPVQQVMQQEEPVRQDPGLQTQQQPAAVVDTQTFNLKSSGAADVEAGQAEGALAAADEQAQQEQDWEDVVPAVQQQPVAVATTETAEGTAADYDADELVGDFQADQVPDPAAAARQATVLDQLSDLVKQAQLATSKTLLDWLRMLTQLQLPEPQRQQQRQHLRAVVDLRAQLQAALSEAANFDVQPATAASSHDRRQPEQASSQPAAADEASLPQHNAAAVIEQGNAAAGVGLGQLPSRSDQPLQLPARAAEAMPAGRNGAAHLTFGANFRRHVEQQQVADVYAGLQDPTAVARGIYIIPKEMRKQAEEGRWVQLQASDSDSEQHGAGSAGQSGTPGSLHKPSSAEPSAKDMTTSGQQGSAGSRAAGTAKGDKPVKGLDPSLRQKLAATAPKLSIAGDDWLLAQHGVMSHGMELYNHWGAVDATAGIPQDRLKELVGYTASYYKPNKKKQKAADRAASNSAAASQAVAAVEAAGASKEAAAKSRAATNSQPLVPADEAAVAASTGSQIQQGDENNAAAAQGGAAGAAGAAAEHAGASSEHDSVRRGARSQRESASAHNRAVIAAAYSDEAVAAALQLQLNAEAADAKGGKRRAAKPPETKAHKIRKKLLGFK